jgi:hypothetical protein
VIASIAASISALQVLGVPSIKTDILLQQSNIGGFESKNYKGMNHLCNLKPIILQRREIEAKKNIRFFPSFEFDRKK